MAVPDYSRMDVSTPAERRNLAVVERLYDEVINKRDLRVADSLFSSSLLQHNPLYGEGVAGFKDYLSGFYFDQFADLRVSIEVAVAQNNRVMAFTTWTGRHVESGAELSLPVADVYRVWDGRLIEHWDMTDYTELVKYGVARPETAQPADPLDKFGTPAQLMNLDRLRPVPRRRHHRRPVPGPPVRRRGLRPVHRRRRPGPGRLHRLLRGLRPDRARP